MDRHRHKPPWFIFMKYEKENNLLMRCIDLVWNIIWSVL